MNSSEHESDAGVPILPVSDGGELEEDLLFRTNGTGALQTDSAGWDNLPSSSTESFGWTDGQELQTSEETSLRRSLSSGFLETLRSRDDGTILSSLARRNILSLSNEQQSVGNVTDTTKDEERYWIDTGEQSNEWLVQTPHLQQKAQCSPAEAFEASNQASLIARSEPISEDAFGKDQTGNDGRFSRPPPFPSRDPERDELRDDSAPTLDRSFRETPNAIKKPKRTFNTLPCFKFDLSGRASMAKVTTSEILAESRASRDTNSVENGRTEASDPVSEEPRRWAEWRMRKKDRKRLQAALRGVLQSRDLRQIHPTTRPKPVIIVRRHVIIVSLVHLRAVIFAEQLLLFNPEDHSVRQSARSIEERLTAAQSDRAQEAPFELHALESILIEVCVALERDLACIEPSLMRLLNEITRKIGGRKLEEMLYLKQMLSNFSVRVDGVRDALQDLLGEDEDMARMYLTEMKKHPETERPPTAHEQVEELLESYLRVLDHLASRVKLLSATIDDTEGLVDLQLDSMRNRILRISVLMTVLTSVFAGAGVVNRFFSMNLQLPIYGTDSVWFIGFVAITAFTVPLTIVCLFWWARRAGILSV
ncbi:magnesium ion transporter [Cyanidiococcus yangmingshanensis]|uniref:Magnesium transporter n=1 Tax=Cyanidiococcus yangmingshanensis TaxID=2690220 RepID=A0A7J7IGR2_9RHOD|nr:magnesium ion transporter [Cyanidiococcus yangmingshanensis]